MRISPGLDNLRLMATVFTDKYLGYLPFSILLLFLFLPTERVLKMIWFCDHFCIQVSTQDSAFPASFEDPQLKHFVVIHQGYYDQLDAIAKNPRAHRYKISRLYFQKLTENL